jgi:hypothetical protein
MSAGVTTTIVAAAIITWGVVSTVAVSIAITIVRSSVHRVSRCNIRNSRGHVNARSIVIALGGVNTHPNARSTVTISASINDCRRSHCRE